MEANLISWDGENIRRQFFGEYIQTARCEILVTATSGGNKR